MPRDVPSNEQYRAAAQRAIETATLTDLSVMPHGTVMRVNGDGAFVELSLWVDRRDAEQEKADAAHEG